MKNIRPDFLKIGDTVGVIAIASAPTQQQLSANWKEQLGSWGLKVKIGKHIEDKAPGDFAGQDICRAEDLMAMVKDPEVKAILSIRGGFGTMRTLEYVDMQLFKDNPKWLVGFSDITILHYALQHIGIESIHGAMPGTFSEEFDGFSQLSLKNALFGHCLQYTTAAHKFNHFGEAKGLLVGGNLTLMTNLIGTPTDADFSKDSILFIEDVSEKMYLIDSKMWRLKKCGHLAKVKGIIVGQFSETEGEEDWDRSVYDLIYEYTRQYDIPVMYGLQCGHEDLNVALYLGRTISLSVNEAGGEIKFL